MTWRLVNCCVWVDACASATRRGSECHRCPQDGGAPHAFVDPSDCGSCVQSIGHTPTMRIDCVSDAAQSTRCEECES
eukprot:3783255-Prymnesium_polylepis.1